ncbi:hypothetical protein D3C87_2173830 [compost metagenome]
MTDDDLYKKISSRASKVARENFTIKSYADQFAHLVYGLTKPGDRKATFAF